MGGLTLPNGRGLRSATGWNCTLSRKSLPFQTRWATMTMGTWLTLACNINIGCRLGCSLNGGALVLLSVTNFKALRKQLRGLLWRTSETSHLA